MPAERNVASTHTATDWDASATPRPSSRAAAMRSSAPSSGASVVRSISSVTYRV